MSLHKQPSRCGTCGLPVADATGVCTECTAITERVGDEAWRSPAPSRPLEPGDVLEGKWRLEKLLGAGGMGRVFRATDVALERPVAIKLLHDALCQDPSSVARFEREARAMARLEHAHITPIYAVGRDAGRPFIVMKLLEGVSLSHYLRSAPGPLPVAEVLALARQLCAGLDFIHQRGCVHRDIKPGNIFLSPGGHATLLDFGILWEHRGAGATTSGVMLGTPGYMAPEQARGEPVDGRADLFSLGLVLVELLTGLPPSKSCRLLGEGARHAAEALRGQASWLSPRMAEVLARAAALNPEQRYGNAIELFASMQEAAGGDSKAVKPVQVTPGPPAPRSLPGRSRRRLLALGLVSAAGIFSGVLLGISHFRGSDERSPVEMASTGGTAAVTPVAAPAPAALVVPDPAPVLSRPAVQEQERAAMPPSAVQEQVAPSPPVAEAESPVPRAAPSSRSQKSVTARNTGPAASGASARAGKEARQRSGELRVVTVHDGKTVWADISVDGQHHGATPVSLSLPAGRHSVRVERNGFSPVERKVDIPAGERIVVRIELGP
ncbi:serine/threonine-protein kinase [Hyalangium versicolor]|uniref:serine/threonine-protein kinase n=1 Tax=Hyalangium versicolor TaxID=2861190 RepID=UPI001CCBDCE9|nr:serine/threonine-protein kinase [Hyalangium versicolor]